MDHAVLLLPHHLDKPNSPALIQSKIIHDLILGYPLAYLGWVVFYAKMAHSKLLLTSSTELFKAKAYREDECQSSRLGTLLIIQIRRALSIMPLVLRTGTVQYMLPDATRQRPLLRPSLVGSSACHTTQYSNAVAKCKATNAALQLDQNALGYKVCVCANGNNEWSSKGCNFYYAISCLFLGYLMLLMLFVEYKVFFFIDNQNYIRKDVPYQLIYQKHYTVPLFVKI
jgi:hypothetical protein